jgi:hypothetical protein
MAEGFNLARRLSARNEPDLLRKSTARREMVSLVDLLVQLLLTLFSSGLLLLLLLLLRGRLRQSGRTQEQLQSAGLLQLGQECLPQFPIAKGVHQVPRSDDVPRPPQHGPPGPDHCLCWNEPRPNGQCHVGSREGTAQSGPSQASYDLGQQPPFFLVVNCATACSTSTTLPSMLHSALSPSMHERACMRVIHPAFQRKLLPIYLCLNDLIPKELKAPQRNRHTSIFIPRAKTTETISINLIN